MLTGLQSLRYEKHIDLPFFGEHKQEALLNAKVAMIGAGGLGCPTALYLAASGLGSLTLIDNDEISMTNLARQILYSSNQLGEYKVDVAKERLGHINSDCKVTPVCERLNRDNARFLLADCDLIIDASDNFDTRYYLNEISLVLRKPLLSGAVVHYGGQVILLHPEKDSGNPCYQCLYPVRPEHHEVPACLDSGVLSPVTGVIGSLMATEAIKYLSSSGITEYNKITMYNALDNSFSKIKIPRQPNCVCGCAK